MPQFASVLRFRYSGLMGDAPRRNRSTWGNSVRLMLDALKGGAASPGLKFSGIFFSRLRRMVLQRQAHMICSPPYPHATCVSSIPSISSESSVSSISSRSSVSSVSSVTLRSSKGLRPLRLSRGLIDPFWPRLGLFCGYGMTCKGLAGSCGQGGRRRHLWA